jgi:predicted O-methyltransferase YrrM
MADRQRLNVFLDSLYRGNSALLENMEKEAHRADVPVIRKGTQSVMRMLLALKQPVEVLEIGTAVGFSAVFILQNSDAHVTTIENYEPRIAAARENFRRAGVEDRITFLTGDAQNILPELTGSYDFIFMDAAKGQYSAFLPDVMRLLASGGVLVTDNVLQEGEILESHYAVERRNRTIYKRMREYLREITEDPRLVTTVIETGDGMAISVKTDMPDGVKTRAGTGTDDGVKFETGTDSVMKRESI